MHKQRYVRREDTDQPLQPRGPIAQVDPRSPWSPGNYEYMLNWINLQNTEV